MLRTFTAKYVKTESGYMGQLVEWPEVITEGHDLDDCRAMLDDALHEMIAAHKELDLPVPISSALYEPVLVEY